MKKILGLDLGTNSIGWALISHDFDLKNGKIDGLGSRIIPMTQDILGKFDSGISISQTAERTEYRGIRRLTQRYLLRRERLHRVLDILGFLPYHYREGIDFEKHYGQFKTNVEVKINYKKNKQGKYEFIFKESFDKMIEEFKIKWPTIKIPYDWTLYYLRKKALTQKIKKEELAWVILSFNQKRGYYQLRGEEENSTNNKNEEYYSLIVKNVEATEDKSDKGVWYNVILENDWIYRRQSKEPLESWIGKSKEFIVTTYIEKDGSLKKDAEGKTKRSFRRVDSEKDWIAIKKKTEQDIEKKNTTVGEYIYENLLANPNQKIKGELIRTIDRKYYKEEFEKIIKKQIEFHSELQDTELYKKCIFNLYPKNEAHRNNISNKNIGYLLSEDIIYYQRPLKSKKSSISGCQYEYRNYKKEVIRNENGVNVRTKELVREPIKAVSKSHPLYQEFRLWQFIKNLKIYQKEKQIENSILYDINITANLLKEENDWIELFDFLSERKEIDQKAIINYFVSKRLINSKKKSNYRWNYVEDKKYPANETKAQFLSRLSKVAGVDAKAFLTTEKVYKLWHIVYSVKDRIQYEQALKSFARKNNLDTNSFIENFKRFPPFKSDYGAYSEKALKKILPLMRMGKYWNEEDIPIGVRNRIILIMERVNALNISESSSKKDINEALQEVSDDDIPLQIVKSFIPLKNKVPFKGLNTYQACYAVYERHSEIGDVKRWKTPGDIDRYLFSFKQHSLRNPIVEQLVTETLRTVRDIWKYYGESKEGFFDEIHLELGREMKNPADKRKKIARRNIENENTNQRIKALLQELMNDGIKDIRPHSPSQQEILKIYEEGVYQSIEIIDSDIEKIRKSTTPTKAEINRYKLWLEQKYISPYTGKIIPLSKLFTTEYQIEHIIPQSRYFDNSFSNKIICESEVNQIKGNQTAYKFIKDNPARIIDLGQGKTVRLFTLEQYEHHVNIFFKKNRTKLKKLLSEDIPEGFIERQLNDSRYISKLVKGLLSNVVREPGEKEATTKNLVSVTGAITSKLKQDWGLNDKWNEIISPRFKRLNELTKSTDFGYWDSSINAFRIQVPDEISRGFSLKRIDHRHHALDALVIALTSKRHINYLNSLNSEKENFGLRKSLLQINKHNDFTKHFLHPWSNFTIEAKNNLEKIIVSFKQNIRIINKSNNKTWQWVQKHGKYTKQLVKQTKGVNWAIRKPLHKETVYGKVSIKTKRKSMVSLNSAIDNVDLIIEKKIKAIIKKALSKYNGNIKAAKKYFKSNPIELNGFKINKIGIYEFVEGTASRVPVSEITTRKRLLSITDSGIRKILENHIAKYTEVHNETTKERFDLAFSPEGIDDLNKNIIELNNGKFHKPIYKVRIYEAGSRFRIGEIGNKKDKYVEAAKGTNLFFAIYHNEEKNKREYETVPLNKVIEHQKQVAHLSKTERTAIPLNHQKGRFLFSLSPNDLVYVPTDEEIQNPQSVDFNNLSIEQVDRTYKMVSSSGNQCFFIRHDIAKSIKNKYEFSSLNKMEKSVNGEMIKERCWKLKVDRLGNIINVNKG